MKDIYIAQNITVNFAPRGPKPHGVKESEYRHMRVSAPPFPPAAFAPLITACVAYGRSTVQGSAAALPRGSLSPHQPDNDLAHPPQRTERLRQLSAWAFPPNPRHHPSRRFCRLMPLDHMRGALTAPATPSLRILGAADTPLSCPLLAVPLIRHSVGSSAGSRRRRISPCPPRM